MENILGAPPRRRLFTALFPPHAARVEIDALRRRWQGLPRKLSPAPDRLHLTLQFQPAVPPQHEAAWLAALDRLDFQPFDLVLVRAELWHSGRDTLAVLRPGPSAELDALHAATDALARAAGLTTGMQRWKPHVTILRRAHGVRRTPVDTPVCWRVRSLDLVWSDPGASPPCYTCLGHFPAARRPPGSG